MSEILAPAGSKNSALAAINAGADALYLGLSQFSARSAAENFDLSGFKEISEFARAFGVKIYVAMNTMVKDAEKEDFLKSLIAVWNSGADAIIISDVFLGKFIKENYPEIKLHLSTQAGVCNSYAAQLAKDIGFDRVIISRETFFEDIKSIAKIIETEVFVQGALCTCFSGQCYLSSFAGGNSGNRGRCKQPCRKKYSIDRAGFDDEVYRLSLSDLCVGEDISKLIEAGVYSFKIEGRMRRPEYVSAAVKYYKNILQNCVSATDFSDLKRTFNRGNYTKGLAFGQEKSFISSAVQGHIGEFVGLIKVESGKYVCKTKEKFVKGDSFKILRDGKEVGGADFSENRGDGFTLNSKVRLLAGDKVFVTTDSTVNSRLLSAERKIPVKISAEFFSGRQAAISVNGIRYEVGKLLDTAKSRPLSETDIQNCFNKVDKYPFAVEFGVIKTDGVFIAASELNALRREIFAEYFAAITENKNIQLSETHSFPIINTAVNTKTAVICGDLRGIRADIGILKPDDYGNCSDEFYAGFKGEKYIYLPPFVTDREAELLKPLAEKFDGVYSDGIWALKFCEKLGKPLFAGCGMNISNTVGVNECSARYVALSKELTKNEIEKLSTEKTFALTAGDVKVMDLIYCPFGRKCNNCDRRRTYTLTDESGRKFPMRRYKTSVCRFEIFNCASLLGNAVTGALIDSTLDNPAKLLACLGDEGKMAAYLKNYTRGHFNSPVL